MVGLGFVRQRMEGGKKTLHEIMTPALDSRHARPSACLRAASCDDSGGSSTARGPAPPPANKSSGRQPPTVSSICCVTHPPPETLLTPLFSVA